MKQLGGSEMQLESLMGQGDGAGGQWEGGSRGQHRTLGNNIGQWEQHRAGGAAKGSWGSIGQGGQHRMGPA